MVWGKSKDQKAALLAAGDAKNGNDSNEMLPVTNSCNYYNAEGDNDIKSTQIV